MVDDQLSLRAMLPAADRPVAMTPTLDRVELKRRASCPGALRNRLGLCKVDRAVACAVQHKHRHVIAVHGIVYDQGAPIVHDSRDLRTINTELVQRVPHLERRIGPGRAAHQRNAVGVDTGLRCVCVRELKRGNRVLNGCDRGVGLPRVGGIAGHKTTKLTAHNWLVTHQAVVDADRVPALLAKASRQALGHSPALVPAAKTAAMDEHNYGLGAARTTTRSRIEIQFKRDRAAGRPPLAIGKLLRSGLGVRWRDPEK